jgi:hypothetical protein
VDDRIEPGSKGRFEDDLGGAAVRCQHLVGLTWIQGEDGGRVDQCIATLDRRLDGGLIEHIAGDGVNFVDPQRSERRLDPFRSTNQELDIVASPEHRLHRV